MRLIELCSLTFRMFQKPREQKQERIKKKKSQVHNKYIHLLVNYLTNNDEGKSVDDNETNAIQRADEFANK